MPSLLEHFRGEEIIADHFDTENRAFAGLCFLYGQWREPREMGGTGVFSSDRSGQVDCFCFHRAHFLLLNGCKSVKCDFVPGPVGHVQSTWPGNITCIKRGFMGYHCNYGAPLFVRRYLNFSDSIGQIVFFFLIRPDKYTPESETSTNVFLHFAQFALSDS